MKIAPEPTLSGTWQEFCRKLIIWVKGLFADQSDKITRLEARIKALEDEINP